MTTICSCAIRAKRSQFFSIHRMVCERKLGWDPPARQQIVCRSHSVAGIIGRCIAHATSARGGGRPASTRSRLPAGFGKRRTEWRARADQRLITDKLEGQADQDQHERPEPRRAAIDTAHLGFQPIQKIATIHAISGFIRAIPVEKDNPCRIRSKSGRDQRWDTGLLAMDPAK
jgi:hypothetical protein